MNKPAAPVAPSVQFQQRSIQGRRCLVVTFEGHLSKVASEVAALRMREFLVSESGPHCMVWDCRAMSGYDMDARNVWQAVLKEYRARVSAIHLISESLMIRLGAAGVGAFTRLPIRAWKSESEVVFDRAPRRPRPSLAPP